MNYKQLDFFEDKNKDSGYKPAEYPSNHVTQSSLFTSSQVLAVRAEILIEKLRGTFDIDNPIFKELCDATQGMEEAVESYFEMFKEDK